MPLSLLHKGRRKWMGRREISGTSRRTGGRKMQERRRPVQARRRRRAQRVWEAAPYRHPGPQERAATLGRPYKNEMRVRDGRVRTPAPTKFGGIFRFCRRGRRPRRPAGAHCAPLQQGSPLRRHPNVPDRPTGGASPSPTVLKKLFRDWVGEALGPPAGICTGSVGSVKPGAPTGPHQPKFLQTQGPVARLEFRHSLRFCAPEILCQAKGITPVNGVRGKATMSTKCSSGAVPGGVLPTLPPWAK